MKKRLMMLLLATTFAFSTVAMTGCGDTDSKDEKDKDDKDDDDKDDKDKDDKDSKKKSNDDDDDDNKSSKKKKNDDDDDDKGSSAAAAGGTTLEDYLIESGQMAELEEVFENLGKEGMDVTIDFDGNEMIMVFDIDVEVMAGKSLTDEQMEQFEEGFVSSADAEFDQLADEAFDELYDGIEAEGIEIDGKITLTIVVNNANTGNVIWSNSFTR